MSEYSIEKVKKYTIKLRELISELPPCCAEYFRGIEQTTGIMTRYGYAVDLKTFFEYLLGTDSCSGMNSIREIDLKTIESVDAVCIECFLEYVSLYNKNENERSELTVNGERAKARKLAAIRSLYKYLYKKQRISTNAPSLVDTPKLHEKPIIRLEPDEILNLLQTVENGEGLTERQKLYHKSTWTI